MNNKNNNFKLTESVLEIIMPNVIQRVKTSEDFKTLNE